MIKMMFGRSLDLAWSGSVRLSCETIAAKANTAKVLVPRRERGWRPVRVAVVVSWSMLDLSFQ